MTSLCCPPVQVSAHYELIKEFDIAVPPIELAAFQMIEADLTALSDALYASEANKEDNIVRFQRRAGRRGRVACEVPSRPVHFLVVPQPLNSQQRMLVHLLSQNGLQHVDTDSEQSHQRRPSDWQCSPGMSTMPFVHQQGCSLASWQAQTCMQRASSATTLRAHDSSKLCK